MTPGAATSVAISHREKGSNSAKPRRCRCSIKPPRVEDALVVASGTPHVDVHKLWDCSSGASVFMEVGFSCMGHEIPAALGLRMAPS